MRYPGGKHRIARRLAEEIVKWREKGQPYYEPFLGMGNVFSRMENPRYGSDLNPALINMWNAVLGGWVPPTSVEEDQYQWAKKNLPDDSPLRAFIGHQCSFGGRYFSTYARGSTGGKLINFADNGSRSAVEQGKKMKGAILRCMPYWELDPKGALIYADPPYPGPHYQKVYQYNEMQYPRFFLWASRMAAKNTVLVSGYDFTPYPSNFEIVYSVETRYGMHANTQSESTECLFKVNSPTSDQLKEMMNEVPMADRDANKKTYTQVGIPDWTDDSSVEGSS